MIATKHAKIIREQSWHKIDYDPRPSELISLALSCMITDLKNEYGSVNNINYKLIKTEEYAQAYSNSSHEDQMIRLTFEIEYDYKEWVGPRQGNVLVHKRTIPPEVANSPSIDWYKREIDAGMEYVKSFLPTTQTVMCECDDCLSPGSRFPKLLITVQVTDDGGREIEYWVDFDFEKPE